MIINRSQNRRRLVFCRRVAYRAIKLTKQQTYESSGGGERSERGCGRSTLSLVATQTLILCWLQLYLLVGPHEENQQTTTITARRGLRRTGRSYAACCSNRNISGRFFLLLLPITSPVLLPCSATTSCYWRNSSYLS